MGPRGVEFGDKHVIGTRGGDVARPKVHRPGEPSGDVDVAGTINRHPVATVGAGAAEGGGPLMSPRGVEFGDKRILAAGAGDVPSPEINCPVEVAGGVDVAGTINRHRPAIVIAGAAPGG